LAFGPIGDLRSIFIIEQEPPCFFEVHLEKRRHRFSAQAFDNQALLDAVNKSLQ
jgi:hypothetical protein